MSDVDEIGAVLAAYGATFDARDAQAYAGLFTEDGVVVQGGRDIIGRERLARLVERSPASAARHYPETPTVDVAGETATASSRFRYDTGQGRSLTGDYEDELRRTPEGWRIVRRGISMDPIEGLVT